MSQPEDTKPKLRAHSTHPYADPILYSSLAIALQYLTFHKAEYFVFDTNKKFAYLCIIL